MIAHFDRLAMGVASVLLLILSAMTLVDVVGRNFFHSPLPGATELTELGLVAITFLLYPHIAYRHHHIVIDLFDSWTPPGIRWLQNAVAGLVGAIVFGVLAWRLWIQGTRVATYGDVTPYLSMPVYPAFYFMAILSAFTTLAFLLTIFKGPVDHGAEPRTGLE